MREQGGVLLGVVAGTEDYRVSLGLLGDELASSCTCPVGRDGSFCKHVVALGLAWLDASRPRGPSGEELREHLLGRTREELVDLLLERAAEDEWLHGRLALAAASSGGGPPDVAALAAAIDAAVETGGFVPYRKAYDYFRTVDEAATYPGGAFIGPMAALLNENSASDGDIFPYMFRKAGLGPLIGKRSWGGVVGIQSRGPLIDGGTIFVPGSGLTNENGEWIIEGYGVDPDIEVDNDPKSEIEGRDPQLERGISEVMVRLKQPVKLPPKPPGPVKVIK